MSQTSICLCKSIKPIQAVSLTLATQKPAHLQQNLALESHGHCLVLSIF